MEKLLNDSNGLKIDRWYPELETIIREKTAFLKNPRGNFYTFKNIVDSIPDFMPSRVNCDQDAVKIGQLSDLSAADRQLLREKLLQLSPWRKGPFNIFGIPVDSEWQSFLKWNRLQPHLKKLTGQRILDIGSSNGYYMFRMTVHHPAMVLGLEPQSYFYNQYLALQKFLKIKNVYCLPIPFNELPVMTHYFDSVFCMGILYHRKSPVGMLKQIHDIMAPKGEIILENLVLESKDNICLFPRDRYAKMRNVFFIPDLSCMESWLARAGFKDIRCIDITRTTSAEQRRTPWIQTESLDDFLDPDNPEKTIEGYPAPVRAIFLASA